MRRHELTREDFLKAVWQWKLEYGGGASRAGHLGRGFVHGWLNLCLPSPGLVVFGSSEPPQGRSSGTQRLRDRVSKLCVCVGVRCVYVRM